MESDTSHPGIAIRTDHSRTSATSLRPSDSTSTQSGMSSEQLRGSHSYFRSHPDDRHSTQQLDQQESLIRCMQQVSLAEHNQSVDPQWTLHHVTQREPHSQADMFTPYSYSPSLQQSYAHPYGGHPDAQPAYPVQYQPPYPPILTPITPIQQGLSPYQVPHSSALPQVNHGSMSPNTQLPYAPVDQRGQTQFTQRSHNRPAQRGTFAQAASSLHMPRGGGGIAPSQTYYGPYSGNSQGPRAGSSRQQDSDSNHGNQSGY